MRLVAESREHHDSEWAAITSVAAMLGCRHPETVRKWVRRAEIDAGARPGGAAQESAELRKLRAEVRELRRAIVLGEPTSALDAESERWIREAVRAIGGTALVVLITHRESTLPICDLVVRVSAGRLVVVEKVTTGATVA